MGTKTDICNMALIHCAITPSLEDVDDDDSNEAINCRAMYPQVRDLLLETVPWPFLERQVTLQTIDMTGTGYENLWSYMYVYPSDAKRINFIVDPSQRTPQKAEDQIPYKVVDYPGFGRAILCDQEDAIANINFWQTEPDYYPTVFTEPLSLGIGARVARPLKVDAKLQQTISQDFNQWLATAQSAAKSERQDDPNPSSEFEQARG